MTEWYFREISSPDNTWAIGIDSHDYLHVVKIYQNGDGTIWSPRTTDVCPPTYCEQENIIRNVIPLIPATAFLAGNLLTDKVCKKCLVHLALVIEENIGDSTYLSMFADRFIEKLAEHA